MGKINPRERKRMLLSRIIDKRIQDKCDVSKQKILLAEKNKSNDDTSQNKSNIDNDIEIESTKTINEDKIKKVQVQTSFKVRKPQTSKKNKLKLKKQILLQKIELVQQAKKAEIDKKKRQRTVLIGDLHPLRDSLPSLETLMKIKPHQLKTGIPSNEKDHINKSKQLLNKQQTRKKGKEYKQRINLFQQLLSNETYKNNPREAIANHIKLTMLEKAGEN